MSNKSVSISVDKHDGNIGERLFEIASGGIFGVEGAADRFEAKVQVGDRVYSGKGYSHDEAVNAAKHEAGID